MNQDYFSKFSDMAKKAQEPLQAIAELNAKTFQDLTYMKPEELLAKQIELAVANGHKALDYMQKSFQILEKAMLSLVQETKIDSKK